MKTKEAMKAMVLLDKKSWDGTQSFEGFLKVGDEYLMIDSSESCMSQDFYFIYNSMSPDVYRHDRESNVIEYLGQFQTSDFYDADDEFNKRFAYNQKVEMAWMTFTMVNRQAEGHAFFYQAVDCETVSDYCL